MKKISIIILTIFNVSLYAQTAKLIPFRAQDKWGVSDYKGNILIAPQYDSVTLFSRDNYLKKDLSIVKKGGKLGIINASGKYIIPLYCISIKQMGSDKNALMIKVGRKYGVVNYLNQVIIPFEYDTLIPFIEEVIVNNRYTYIDFYKGKKAEKYYKITEKGIATEITVNEFQKYGRNSYMYGVSGGYNSYDNKNKKSDILSNKAAIIKKNKKVIDSISDKTFDEYFQVYYKRKVGFVSQEELLNDTIRTMIPPIYDSIIAYYSSRFLLSKDNKITVVLYTGKILMPLKYSEYISWDGYKGITVKENGKVGFYRFDNNVDIQPKYDEIKDVGYDLWYVKLNGKGFYINKEGFEYYLE